ncbi:molybdenum cofactor guanylyltransferase MobA [Pseudomonadota bacterium AL_CKDN230030165-1A_HGKHYDSX7]
MIDKNEITGLILAGGRGSRMGNVDKGLQNFQGIPMAMHALLRLGPQVGAIMINANRNLGAYESMGVPVWPDATADFAGPLAGVAAGLERCETEYLVTVPCDTPLFPLDLVERLAAALDEAGAEIAMVVTPDGDGVRTQPVFCLMRASMLDSLLVFLHSGQGKVERWVDSHACVQVMFDDVRAFTGANTLTELHQLQS